MLLNIEDIKKITFGAEKIFENEKGFAFFRMNEKEKEVYKTGLYLRLPGYYQKSLAASGVRFDFYTDAEEVSFEYTAEKTTSLTACFFDVYCNKELYTSVGFNKEDNIIIGEIKVELPQGEKRVTVYFPNTFEIFIKDMKLDNATILKPVSFKQKMLVYGDSITQGFSSVNPSMSYANRLAFDLDCDYINKGVGGGVFEERLVDASTVYEPDIITMAYGTNDWNATSKARFESNCEAFINGVSRKFKNSKIFVITPLWRLDYKNEKELGNFEDVATYIKSVAKKLDNVYVIDGWNILPHSESFFADRVLHPTDVGHLIMAKKIIENIK